MLVEELKPYEERLEAFCKNAFSWSDREARRNEFKRQNPEFVTKRERKDTLDLEITIIHNRIIDYNNFNNMLQKSMALIDSIREGSINYYSHNLFCSTLSAGKYKKI